VVSTPISIGAQPPVSSVAEPVEATHTASQSQPLLHALASKISTPVVSTDSTTNLLGGRACRSHPYSEPIAATLTRFGFDNQYSGSFDRLNHQSPRWQSLSKPPLQRACRSHPCSEPIAATLTRFGFDNQYSGSFDRLNHQSLRWQSLSKPPMQRANRSHSYTLWLRQSVLR